MLYFLKDSEGKLKGSNLRLEVVIGSSLVVGDVSMEKLNIDVSRSRRTFCNISHMRKWSV